MNIRIALAVALAVLILLIDVHLLTRFAMLIAITGTASMLATTSRARQAKQYDEDLVLVLDELSSALRSGSGLLEGLRSVSRVESSCSGDLRVLLERISAGATLYEAIDYWRQDQQGNGVRTMAAALTLSLDNGGSPARAVESAASIVRDTQEATSMAATHAAQARASFLALTVLPLLLMIPLLSADAAAREFMLHTTTGGAVLVVGTALNVLGAAVMSAMVRRVH